MKTRTHRREMIKLWCFKPLFYLFIYLYFLAAPQGMRDPSSPSIEPVPPAVEARSPSHWTVREVPELWCVIGPRESKGWEWLRLV